MIDRIYSNEFKPEMKNKQVKVAGWVHDKRKLGGLLFLLVRDREGITQVTLPKKFVEPDLFETARGLNKESVVVVTGKLQEESKAPGGFEILPEKIQVISQSATPLPLDPTGKVDANLDTRLDNRVIDLRKREVNALFRIRSTALQAARKYLEKNGFIEAQSPRIISTASEGGTELFPVAFFDKEAFLAQSPQLYKQMMMGTGFDKVYEIATYFRAEEHDTIWHLNEITAIDCEIAFIDDENDVMDLIENLICEMVQGIRENCKAQLELLGKDIPEPRRPFPRVIYDDAVKMLEDAGLKLPWGEDMTTEAEKKLGVIMKEKGHELYFITKYPLEIKPFYTMPSLEDPELSNSFDLEMKGREMISGSQRVHNYDLLVERIKAKDLRPQSFGAYLDAFRFGMPPHGGFGLGIERFLMLLLDLENIREGVLFPRDRKRLTP